MKFNADPISSLDFSFTGGVPLSQILDFHPHHPKENFEFLMPISELNFDLTKRVFKTIWSG